MQLDQSPIAFLERIDYVISKDGGCINADDPASVNLTSLIEVSSWSTDTRANTVLYYIHGHIDSHTAGSYRTKV